MKIRSMLLLPLLLLPWPAWSTDLLLFVIQRSKNANEVQYSLQVDDHCALASDTPVMRRVETAGSQARQNKPLVRLRSAGLWSRAAAP